MLIQFRIIRKTIEWEYSMEQKEEIRLALVAKVPIKEILSYFYPEIEDNHQSEHSSRCPAILIMQRNGLLLLVIFLLPDFRFAGRR